MKTLFRRIFQIVGGPTLIGQYPTFTLKHRGRNQKIDLTSIKVRGTKRLGVCWVTGRTNYRGVKNKQVRLLYSIEHHRGLLLVG